MDQLRHALDWAAVVVAFLSWCTSLLPPLASIVSIAWVVYQWYHSEPQKAKRAAKLNEVKNG